MKVKVLPLMFWMKISITSKMYNSSGKKDLTKILPVFNRDGWYRNRYMCWFEFENLAYVTDKEHFDFHLNCINAKEYDSRIVPVLKKLPKKYLSKKQRKFLYYNDHNEQVRSMLIEQKICFNKFD